MAGAAWPGARIGHRWSSRRTFGTKASRDQRPKPHTARKQGPLGTGHPDAAAEHVIPRSLDATKNRKIDGAHDFGSHQAPAIDGRQLLRRFGVVPLRLTAFEDWLSVRPGMDDLFFHRADDQSPFIPEPKIITNVDTTHIPLDVVLGVVALIALTIYLRARSRRHEH